MNDREKWEWVREEVVSMQKKHLEVCCMGTPSGWLTVSSPTS